MVTRRARSLFAVLFAFALAPIVSMAAAGATEARAHAAMAWMQWNAKPQSAVQGARADLGELAAHHPAATPFTAAEPFRLGGPGDIGATVPTTPRLAADGAPATLHRARAPPAPL